MKHLLSITIAAFLALGLMVQDADARIGGGRSMGAQRSIAAPSRSTQTAPPSQAAPAAAPQPAGNRWLGPLGGLAAGLGLGYLFGHGGFGGMGGMLGTLLMMALVGFAVVFIMRLFTRPKGAGNVQYAGMGNEPAGVTPLSPPAGLGAAPAFGAHPQPNIPAGFDTEGFLRQAKLNFAKLQAVHNSGKLDELHEFTSDEMFESIKQDVQEHGTSRQQTDVVTLNAELLEATTEGDNHWASVRFSGMIREGANAQPEAFQEIWNLAKPVSGATGWVLAGIQQVQ